MEKEIVCESCGGVYDVALAKCPFCDTLNVSGAENEYMEKLEDVHEDMDALKAVPKEEIRQAVRRSGNYLKKVLLGILIAGILAGLLAGGWMLMKNRFFDRRNIKEGFFWQEETFPVLDQMYAEGKYDELAEAMWEAVRKDMPIYSWQHYDFISLYDTIRSTADIIEDEKQGRSLSVGNYSMLMHNQWSLKWLACDGEGRKRFTEEETAALLEAAGEILEDFESRWDFPPEIYDEMFREMEKNDGFVPFEMTEAYAKEWMDKRDKPE